LGGKENDDQTAVTVTGDAAGASSAVAEATAVAALLELGTGTINSNSSSSGNSSHGGGVSGQHSQLTPSDTHHIHTATQDSTLTGGHETRQNGNGDDNDDDEQLSAAIALSLTPFTPAVPAATCPRGGGAEPGRVCRLGFFCEPCRRHSAAWGEERERAERELARGRPRVRAQRRIYLVRPEPNIDEEARGAVGDGGGLHLAAVLGPTMTPPIPITARPHLARGPTGALPRQLTRDPAGSIPESGGAT